MTLSTQQEVIRVSGLRYEYPGPERLTLSVPELAVGPGQHTAIVGPSGCGKTTLLRLIAGILTPESGSVITLGVDHAARSPGERSRERLRSIGMVFQEFALLGYLSALDNILLTTKLAGSDRRAARSRARDLAARVGIAHTLSRRPNRLSQGERQRVAVCRALVNRPRLVICDEPTGNLDAHRSGEIIDLVLRESNSIGATVVTVTHDPAIVDRFARSLDLSDIATLEGRRR